VDLIVIDGGINPAVDDFIRGSIERARGKRARALIIQLDTPGGLLTSTRSIVKEILGAPVPVIVYVAPSGAGAGSAGVFITLAAHIAAMAPGTNIGAAHPVGGGGQEVKGVMGEKIENFTASFSEAIAQKRGRNTEWAIQAVRRSVSITEKEALAKNVIDVVARDIDDLLRERRENAAQRTGEERFSGARRSAHEDVVAARRGDFQRAFGHLMADNRREIRTGNSILGLGQRRQRIAMTVEFTF